MKGKSLRLVSVCKKRQGIRAKPNESSIREFQALFKRVNKQGQKQITQTRRLQGDRDRANTLEALCGGGGTRTTHMTPRLVRWLKQPVSALENYFDCDHSAVALILTKLDSLKIITIDQLLHKREKDLLLVSNWGKKRMEDVFNALEKIGFVRYTKGG